MISEEMLKVVEENSYTDCKELDEAGIVVICKFMFTWAILSEINRYGYEDRWCYSSYEKAKAALDAWDGTGEPTGGTAIQKPAVGEMLTVTKQFIFNSSTD